MRVAGAVLIVFSALKSLHAVSPEALIQQSVDNYLNDYREVAPRYTYTQRDVESHGSTTKVSVSQISIINGIPYERTISRNGEPLTEVEASKEQAKLEKRWNESPSEREKRLKDYEAAPAFLQEVSDAFTFTMLPEQTVEGRPNYVIECRPKPTYRPRSSRAAMFSHIQAKLWIDKQNVQWTKAEAEVLDTISIGWILARVGPGATISIKQTRINDKDWLPGLIDINGDAKILLVKDRPIHEQISSYDFKPVGAVSSVTRQVRK